MADHHLPLTGLEADNLLALLTLLGLLRALESSRPSWLPRARWAGPPWQAELVLTTNVSEDDVAEASNEGVVTIAKRFDTDGRKDVNFLAAEFRDYIESDPERAWLAPALAAEYPIKSTGKPSTAPLVMMFGQGHQHFCERLLKVPIQSIDKKLSGLTDPSFVRRALFSRWDRTDATDAFRWDPEEDQRYALRHGNPSKAGAASTMHGANRLAAIGILSLAIAPGARRPGTPGFRRFGRAPYFVWPLWSAALSLAGIEALISHPDVLAGRLDRVAALGVLEVFRAPRVSNGKFMNVGRASPFDANRQN